MNVKAAFGTNTLQVYSMTGIPINATMSKNGEVLSFSVEGLPAGTYVVRATNMDRTSSWATFLVAH